MLLWTVVLSKQWFGQLCYNRAKRGPGWLRVGAFHLSDATTVKWMEMYSFYSPPGSISRYADNVTNLAVANTNKSLLWVVLTVWLISRVCLMGTATWVVLAQQELHPTCCHTNNFKKKSLVIGSKCSVLVFSSLSFRDGYRLCSLFSNPPIKHAQKVSQRDPELDTAWGNIFDNYTCLLS